MNNEIQLRIKIEKLNWLLKECIGIEEYELCQQIRDLIQKKERELAELENPQTDKEKMGEWLKGNLPEAPLMPKQKEYEIEALWNEDLKSRGWSIGLGTFAKGYVIGTFTTDTGTTIEFKWDRMVNRFTYWNAK